MFFCLVFNQDSLPSYSAFFQIHRSLHFPIHHGTCRLTMEISGPMHMYSAASSAVTASEGPWGAGKRAGPVVPRRWTSVEDQVLCMAVNAYPVCVEGDGMMMMIIMIMITGDISLDRRCVLPVDGFLILTVMRKFSDTDSAICRGRRRRTGRRLRNTLWIAQMCSASTGGRRCSTQTSSRGRGQRRWVLVIMI